MSKWRNWSTPTSSPLLCAHQQLADEPLEEQSDTACDSTVVDMAIGAIIDDLRTKVLTLAKVLGGLDAEADLLEQHARLLLSKAQARRSRVRLLKNWMRLQMDAAGVYRLKDPFVTVWLQRSPPAVDIVDEASAPPEFSRAVLRLPLGLVPSDLRGFLQHLDFDRNAILDYVKSTGEVPPGVAIRSTERHLRVR